MNKVILAALMSLSLFATDYTSMSLEELQALRGSVPVEERTAFQAEMQSRVAAMSEQERAAFSQSMKQSKSDPMDGTGTQMKNGSPMQSGGMGGSGAMGSGNMQHRGGR